MTRWSKVTVVVIATLLGLWFLLAGSQKFLAASAFEKMFDDFGLPASLVPVIGVLELVGAILVLIPRSAIYGAGLIATIMVGATACHLVSGSSPIAAVVALLAALTVGGVRLRARGQATAE